MLEEQADTKEGKVLVDYKPNIDYKTERPDPNDETANEAEEEKNSDTEYAKMELPCQGTLRQ